MLSSIKVSCFESVILIPFNKNYPFLFIFQVVDFRLTEYKIDIHEFPCVSKRKACPVQCYLLDTNGLSIKSTNEI
jgi:hypothetical protein